MFWDQEESIGKIKKNKNESIEITKASRDDKDYINFKILKKMSEEEEKVIRSISAPANTEFKELLEKAIEQIVDKQ